MADDEFVIGFSDSEWTGIAPLLEEDVAMSSLAQDELGHAAALYTLLAEVRADGRDADAIAYDRQPDEYRHARLLDHGRGDWAMTIARRYLYDTADGARLDGLAASSFVAAARARRQDPPRRALPRHARDGVAGAAGRARGRAPRAAARGARGARAGRRDRVLAPRRRGGASSKSGVLAEPMAGLEARWRATITPAVRPPRPADAAGRRRIPDRGRTDHRRALPLALDRVHLGPPFGPGGDLVTSLAPNLAPSPRRVARGRDGRPRRGRRPEIPAISIVDLGIVHRAEIAPDGRIEVELLPTFVGCPAIDAIRRAVSERLATFGRPVDVSDHVRGPMDVRADHARRPRRTSATPGSRRRRSRRTSAARIATPPNVAMDSAFGPTLCRSLFYCRACRQPFESFKAV